MSEPAVTDDFFPREFVRVADFVDPKGKRYVTLAPANDITGEVAHFSKVKATLRVGHVYRVPVKGATFRFADVEWLHEYPDADLVTEWQAQQRASELHAAAKRMEKTEARDTSAIERALEPVAKAYVALPYPHRGAFEVYVLSILRRGGK